MPGEVREGILFSLGNPLLDITARPELEFLQKYDLKPDNAILADEKHLHMYDEMLEKYSLEYSAGGSVLNAARAFEWIIGVPNASTYTGCIGKDQFGEKLIAKSQEAGVNVQFMLHPTQATGKCAVLVTGTSRSLCAYLGAASCFEKSHLSNPEVESLIHTAEFFYIEGYHLAASPESIIHLAEHAAEKNKTFVLNMNAPYLVTCFKEPMMKVLPYVDIIFSNEEEAATFAKEHKFGTTDLQEIALRFIKLPKVNKKKERVIIITQGSSPVILAANGKIELFPVPPIPTEKIIDTNGAGDGFAGGFLAMLVQNKPLDVCVRCGIYTAGEVIQQDGCTLPKESKFKE
uniref:Adenosine kinase n=1 Tax=Hemiscolopendra marginata TaxID=943146 RepID=A0A646QF56_9MYRI